MQKTVSISRELKATRRRENVAGYLFMAPSLLFFLGFVIFPMGMCLVTSAFNYTMTDFSFIGLQNYAELFSDAIFGKSLVNTVIIVVASVPTVCFFSLWVASVIYRLRDVYTSFYRCVFYLPVVTGSVAVTVVWKWMFNPYYGLLNYVFKELGILSRNLNWLGSPDTALWCIILILFTTSIGQPIVLYVSALSNVDHSLVEAAEVDGATSMQVFWRIKWPQINAHHALHPGHHHHQQLPVLRADSAADLGRSQLRDQHHHVLHLLRSLQAAALWLRQRHGRDPGHHHRGVQRAAIPSGQERSVREEAEWITAFKRPLPTG